MLFADCNSLYSEILKRMSVSKCIKMATTERKHRILQPDTDECPSSKLDGLTTSLTMGEP